MLTVGSTSEPICLTQREQRIAELIYQEMTYKEIAKELGLSYGWVKNRIHDLTHKLGVRSHIGIAVMVAEGRLSVAPDRRGGI